MVFKRMAKRGNTLQSESISLTMQDVESERFDAFAHSATGDLSKHWKPDPQLLTLTSTFLLGKSFSIQGTLDK
jgi:hypothetical protein